MRRRFHLVLIVFTISVHLGFCQIENNVGPLPWHAGTIVLNDQTTLQGIMQYLPSQGIAAFRTDDHDADTKTILTTNIAAMWYYDASEGADKKFYSMAFPDENGKENIYFFEVIKEFEDFAVLSKKDQMKSHISFIQKSRYSFKNSASRTLTLTQYEEFFFLSKEGRIEKYLTLLYKKAKADVYNYRNEAITFSDFELFPKYLAGTWPRIKQYLHDNRIKLDRRESIIAALDYYERLLKH